MNSAGSGVGIVTENIPHDPLKQTDRVSSAIKDLIKDHFRIRREPGQTMTDEARKQLTNGFLYGIQHALGAVGGHPDGERLAADVRLLINRDQIDEADAMVDGL